jgi:hypothetical protein
MSNHIPFKMDSEHGMALKVEKPALDILALSSVKFQ